MNASATLQTGAGLKPRPAEQGGQADSALARLGTENRLQTSDALADARLHALDRIHRRVGRRFNDCEDTTNEGTRERLAETVECFNCATDPRERLQFFEQMQRLRDVLEIQQRPNGDTR